MWGITYLQDFILGPLWDVSAFIKYYNFIFPVLWFQHIGPAIPEVSSVWFKLYIYYITGQGPPSLLLSKGTRLRKLPDIFQVRCAKCVFFFFSIFMRRGEFGKQYFNDLLNFFFHFWTPFYSSFIHFFFPIGLWSITHNILGPWSWRRSYVKCAHNVEWCLDSFGSFDSGTVALFETTSFGFWLRRL